MAAESDIMDENTNEDDDGSRFNIGQVLDWMDTSDESELKASRVDGEDKDAHDEGQELYGDLGDLVNNTQVDSVITDMGFDVDALDEMGQEAILGVQEKLCTLPGLSTECSKSRMFAILNPPISKSRILEISNTLNLECSKSRRRRNN